MEWLIQPCAVPDQGQGGSGCTIKGCGKKDCIAFNSCPQQ